MHLPLHDISAGSLEHGPPESDEHHLHLQDITHVNSGLVSADDEIHLQQQIPIQDIPTVINGSGPAYAAVDHSHDLPLQDITNVESEHGHAKVHQSHDIPAQDFTMIDFKQTSEGPHPEFSEQVDWDSELSSGSSSNFAHKHCSSPSQNQDIHQACSDDSRATVPTLSFPMQKTSAPLIGFHTKVSEVSCATNNRTGLEVQCDSSPQRKVF